MHINNVTLAAVTLIRNNILCPLLPALHLLNAVSNHSSQTWMSKTQKISHDHPRQKKTQLKLDRDEMKTILYLKQQLLLSFRYALDTKRHRPDNPVQDSTGYTATTTETNISTIYRTTISNNVGRHTALHHVKFT